MGERVFPGPQPSGPGQSPLADVTAASSQILSLFSFLLHEMGIINEKQRGTGRRGGGTELLACQTWAPTPSWNPIPFLARTDSAFSTWAPTLLPSPILALLSPLLTLRKAFAVCRAPLRGESITQKWPRKGLDGPPRCSIFRFPSVLFQDILM